MFHSQKQHGMVLTRTFADGSQEWHCPTCGRRFIIQWPPNYHRTILEEGDPDALHTGGTGGVELGGGSAPDSGGSLSDPYLAPFQAWADQYGL